MPEGMLTAALRIGEFEYSLREHAAFFDENINDYKRGDLLALAECEIRALAKLEFDAPNEDERKYFAGQICDLKDFINKYSEAV